jgi:hypothetical protein
MNIFKELKFKIKKSILHRHKCPICNYSIDMCQCLFGGSCHPNRYKEREVVLDHLYLFDKVQLRHIIALEKYKATSYGDIERSNILKGLQERSLGR